ncbi:MAG: glycosyltransferase [Acidobacteria bacterium]|jgi:glycosyltransferase involved in cell wall biosynthesis|nr:glycosyltransferase [Acidobacteriota bacterium]
MTVEQFLPAFHFGDAVGNSAWALHRFLLSRGIESRLVAMTRDDCLKDKAVAFAEYQLDPHSVKILHFAVPSALSDFFAGLKGKKALIYHNVTPAHFFAGYSDFFTRFTTAGREQLQRLNQAFDLAVGDSTYNADELRALGFANVHTFPLIVDLDDYGGEPSRAYMELLKNERRNIVFAGRIMPNKKIEDLVRVVFFYKKYISPAVRLIVVGNTRSLPKYFHAVSDLAARFLLTSEDVLFTGHLPGDEFLAVYRLADVFLSMSEHEGFCLPLLESCYFQVPVLAYDAAAVAETLGGAGILLRDKDPARAAGLVEQVLESEPLRRQLQARAAARIESYRRQSDPAVLLDMLSRL